MITGFVRGQSLKIAQSVVAADTINYLTAEFRFLTDEWDGLIKFAHFSSGSYSAHVELTGDAIPASAGLNLTAGEWKVSVTGHAYDGDDLVKRVTTETAALTVRDSGVVNGEPLPVTPSAAEELLGKLETIEGNVAEQLAEQDAAVEEQLWQQDEDVARIMGSVKNVRDDSFLKVWAGTSAQYDEAEKAADTIYLIDMEITGSPASAPGGESD